MENHIKRDIVVILCDQLRCDFLSLYGCRAVPTPNLDRLAGEGVVFDSAISASAVCAPARASMMTGLYPSQHGVWKNDRPFNPGLRCLAEEMNKLGYHTGAFGKLHHNPGLDVKGFQHARQMEEGRLGENDHYWQWLKNRHPEVNDIWNTDYTPETMFSKLPAESHYEHWIASEAIQWIDTVPPDEGFFAWVSFQGPHSPFNPPSEVRGCCEADLLPKVRLDCEGKVSPVEKYRSVLDQFLITPPVDPVKDNHAIRLSYAEMIVFIDQQIGRLLDALAKNGRLKNTTVIFSADHGDMLGDFGLWGKGTLSRSAQLNVPLLIAGHSSLTPGSRSKVLTGNIDIPGTVLDIAGASEPFGLSRSLLKLLDPDGGYNRNINFSELGDGVKIVEDGTYRYCYYPFTGFGDMLRLDGCHDQRVSIEDDSELEVKEREFLKHLMDFEALCNGAHVENYYLVPECYCGIKEKHSGFQRDEMEGRSTNDKIKKALAQAGLNPDYMEFKSDE